MKKASMALAVVAAVSLGTARAYATEEAQPRIQLAILLDTSGSMSGLIDQARTQLWSIVNTFISSRSHGQRPLLEVALYEYGNDGLDAKQGWMRQVLPLTTDLDKMSEVLFALTTNGGSEYCGQVIQRATEDLAWSPSPAVLRVIHIAGNEPFDQGPVNYAEACKTAATKGITVNTIHCGDHATGVQEHWKDGALLADGRYLSIDHNQKVAHIEAPQDDEIARLGTQLNETYVPFGSDGRRGAQNQVAQDANAVQVAAGVMVQRAVTKASSNYSNASWDLVDATRGPTPLKVEEVKVEDLPGEMQKMTPAERKAHVEAKAQARQQIQQRIAELNTARAKHVEQELTKRAASGADTLDSAIIKTVREQAQSRGYTFE